MLESGYILLVLENNAQRSFDVQIVVPSLDHKDLFFLYAFLNQHIHTFIELICPFVTNTC